MNNLQAAIDVVNKIERDIAVEFARQGVRWSTETTAAAARKLARALLAQEVEYGEVAIMAACIGYITAR